MIDETKEASNQGWSEQPSTGNIAPEPGTTAPTGQPIAFCQDCGRGLTAETRRTVGNSTFCDPCLNARMAGPANPGTVPPPYAPTGTMPPIPGEPSPALAGLLGFIPGVGAMYNGQFAKGIAHICIFAILTWMSNHVSDFFGIMVAGWVFYQVFDAIHTARARRDGLPLPNTFGLNDIGERFGYHSANWQASRTNTPPGSTGWNASGSAASTPPTPSSTAASTAWAPVPPAPQSTAPPPVPPPPAAPPAPHALTPASPAAHSNWAGYIPPTAFSGNAPYTAPVPPATSIPAAGAAPAWTPTSTGSYSSPVADAAANPYAVSAAQPLTYQPSGRSFPAAAIWLIGLGVIFLIANVVSWHWSGRWITPLVLAMIAVMMFAQRLSSYAKLRASGPIGRAYFTRLLRVPVFLAGLAILFALQALDIYTLGQTWGLLLVLLGVVMLAERLIGMTAPQPVVPPTYAVGTSWNAAPTAAAPAAAPVPPAAAPAVAPDTTEPILPTRRIEDERP